MTGDRFEPTKRGSRGENLRFRAPSGGPATREARSDTPPGARRGPRRDLREPRAWSDASAEGHARTGDLDGKRSSRVCVERRTRASAQKHNATRVIHCSPTLGDTRTTNPRALRLPARSRIATRGAFDGYRAHRTERSRRRLPGERRAIWLPLRETVRKGLSGAFRTRRCLQTRSAREARRGKAPGERSRDSDEDVARRCARR